MESAGCKTQVQSKKRTREGESDTDGGELMRGEWDRRGEKKRKGDYVLCTG